MCLYLLLLLFDYVLAAPVCLVLLLSPAEYATERNDTEAALSPPRTIRSREYCFDGPASVTKIWTRKKRVDVDAATAVGPALLTGPAPREDTPLTTYQAACSGQAVVETAPRRSLVRRVQDIGGRTSLSLVFDPTAAGVRNYIEPFANPVLTSVQPPVLPVHTGRRFQNPVPAVDQVCVTPALVSSSAHAADCMQTHRVLEASLRHLLLFSSLFIRPCFCVWCVVCVCVVNHRVRW